MTHRTDHRARGAIGEPQSSGGTVSLGEQGATKVGGASSAGTHTASGALQTTATVEHPVGIGVAWPPAPPRERAPGADIASVRAQGPGQILSRLRPFSRLAQYYRDDLTPPKQDEMVSLLVSVMASGKRRPFEREPGEIYPVDNWAEVHLEMMDLTAACFSKTDALSKGMTEQHGDQVLDLVDYLFEYTHGKLGTSPHNDPATRGNGSTDDYAEGAQWGRAVLFRVPAGIVRELRLDPGAQGSETLSRARDMCQRFFERESGCPPMREFGFHVPYLYDWNKTWMRSMTAHVFPTAAADRRRFLAAWGSFVQENPREAMFFDPVFRELYERGLVLTDSDAHGSMLSDPEVLIGRLFAYGHLNFEGFGPDDPLFKKFREGSSRRQRMGFAHYAGKYIRLGCPSGRDFDGPRVIASWEWLLEHPDPEILSMLGPWICSRSRMFTPDKLADLTLRTLTATDGRLDDDAGLQHSLKMLVDAAPEKTLRSLELFFSKENMDNQPFRKVLYLANRRPWSDAIEALSSSDSPQTQLRASNLSGFLAGVHWKFQREQHRQTVKLLGGGRAQ